MLEMIGTTPTCLRAVFRSVFHTNTKMIKVHRCLSTEGDLRHSECNYNSRYDGLSSGSNSRLTVKHCPSFIPFMFINVDIYHSAMYNNKQNPNFFPEENSNLFETFTKVPEATFKWIIGFRKLVP